MSRSLCRFPTQTSPDVPPQTSLPDGHEAPAGFGRALKEIVELTATASVPPVKSVHVPLLFH